MIKKKQKYKIINEQKTYPKERDGARIEREKY